jgi:type III restriction enzyme
MRVELMDFQVDAVAELRRRFSRIQSEYEEDGERGALLLNAPTGAGKTLMATALIEELLFGCEAEGDGGDPELTFVWLTDDPQLNIQSAEKLETTSSYLLGSVVIVDAAVNSRELAPGKVYLLNTQKLAAGSNLLKVGDGRDHSLWETLDNTFAERPTKTVLILDEAHRGARGAEAEAAESIMQRFVKGNGDMRQVPLIIGISATPDRFVNLCRASGHQLRSTDVDPARVRESGLLKDFIDLYHPDEEQSGGATMLEHAVALWQRYCERWAELKLEDGERRVHPVLIVQVEDTRAGAGTPTRTDMDMVMGTLSRLIPHDGNPAWVAHAFQDDTALEMGGHQVRHLAPSKINADPDVKVVLAKTSLNTGWDCPRAEVLVSFRAAKDKTNITQMVGRMVRTPLARRVNADEFLNSVALFLPHYDRKALDGVIQYLTEQNPGSEVRESPELVSLTRATGLEDCFAVWASLPTYTLPRTHVMKPVPRLAKLAGLLNETGLEPDAHKLYRQHVLEALRAEYERVAGDDEYAERLLDAGELTIRRVRHGWGDGKQVDENVVKASIAAYNVEDLYRDAGRILSEGLNVDYLATRLETAGDDDETSERSVKLELYALVTTPGVMDAVNDAANELRNEWTAQHKAAIRNKGEKTKQVWKAILATGGDPAETTVDPPTIIEVPKKGNAWPKHLFVGADGSYNEELNTWEERALNTELARTEVVGWVRNLDRKPWSLCVPRRSSEKWSGVYPDFIVFRRVGDALIADVIDPHLLDDQYAPQRAKAMAEFAKKHASDFGRIELIIYESPTDAEGKRLDLCDEDTRRKVADVTTHEHLKLLFDAAKRDV